MWILLQEREQRLRERAMNVEERRYLVPSLLERSFQIHGLVTDLFRYDAMPSRRHPVYSAVPANEQTRCAISEERHKSVVQAKGKSIPRNRGPMTYSFSCRYIKELAERVNRLENSGATPPDMQYAPVIHDPSGPGSAYSPPLEYNRHRNHGMMMGQQNFEQDHQELLEFSPGHRGTNTDAAANGLQVPRVLHPTSLVHQQTRDTLNNMAPDPSVYE